MSLQAKEKTHVRLVFLGAAGVGKTALIRRFLQDTFETKHRRTVEELHSKELDVSGVKVTIEIMDTSGSYSFPAMRKLSIQSGDAFALVYAVDDPESLEAVKGLRDEILEVRADKRAPVVVVANKADRGAGEGRLVPGGDLLSGGGFLEASAKENENVLELFRELLRRADLPGCLSPAAPRRRRETFPKEGGPAAGAALRPPMNKTNSCSVS